MADQDSNTAPQTVSDDSLNLIASNIVKTMVDDVEKSSISTQEVGLPHPPCPGPKPKTSLALGEKLPPPPKKDPTFTSTGRKNEKGLTTNPPRNCPRCTAPKNCPDPKCEKKEGLFNFKIL